MHHLSTMLSIFQWLMLSLCVQDIFAQTPGWNLLFGTTVPEEVVKKPLNFDNPVPKWIKGSLVSNIFLF